jgi:hypothetical protein
MYTQNIQAANKSDVEFKNMKIMSLHVLQIDKDAT